MEGQTPDGRVVRFSRPGRPVRVLRDLRELRGPTTGVVRLPLRLAWTPPQRFDLAILDDLRWMYEIVLREAIHADELRQFIDGPTLVRLWPELNLPRGVRRAWEDHHPALRRAA